MPKPAAPSFQPLYLQIKSLLEQSLEAREWAPGKPIPSEIDLAGRFGVSQGTVRKAIDALAADNLVVRRQGKGTFVATHTEERASKFRFLRIRRNDGRDEYPASRLLDLRRGKASAECARLLDLKPGDPILALRRVLEWTGEPVVLDEITLPAALFRGLTRQVRGLRWPDVRLLRVAVRGAYAEAQEEACRHRRRSGERRNPGRRCRLPLLAVERVTLTYGDRPVELRRGLCTTRAHHYSNELF
jgi:GntR family transcriptional regulator